MTDNASASLELWFLFFLLILFNFYFFLEGFVK